MKDGVLKGILWHQGEADSRPDRAGVYEAKLHALIARLRDDLGAPDVPFIAGQMLQDSDPPWDSARRQVDKVHRTVEHVPSDLGRLSDGQTRIREKVSAAAFVSNSSIAAFVDVGFKLSTSISTSFPRR